MEYWASERASEQKRERREIEGERLETIDNLIKNDIDSCVCDSVMVK